MQTQLLYGEKMKTKVSLLTLILSIWTLSLYAGEVSKNRPFEAGKYFQEGEEMPTTAYPKGRSSSGMLEIVNTPAGQEIRMNAMHRTNTQNPEEGSLVNSIWNYVIFESLDGQSTVIGVGNMGNYRVGVVEPKDGENFDLLLEGHSSALGAGVKTKYSYQKIKNGYELTGYHQDAKTKEWKTYKKSTYLLEG